MLYYKYMVAILERIFTTSPEGKISQTEAELPQLREQIIGSHNRSRDLFLAATNVPTQRKERLQAKWRVFHLHESAGHYRIEQGPFVEELIGHLKEKIQSGTLTFAERHLHEGDLKTLQANSMPPLEVPGRNLPGLRSALLLREARAIGQDPKLKAFYIDKVGWDMAEARWDRKQYDALIEYNKSLAEAVFRQRRELVLPDENRKQAPVNNNQTPMHAPSASRTVQKDSFHQASLDFAAKKDDPDKNPARPGKRFSRRKFFRTACISKQGMVTGVRDVLEQKGLL